MYSQHPVTMIVYSIPGCTLSFVHFFFFGFVGSCHLPIRDLELGRNPKNYNRPIRCHSCFDGNKYPSLRRLGVGDIFFFCLGVFVAIRGFFFQPLFCPFSPLIGPFDDKLGFGRRAPFFIFFGTIGAFSFGDTLVDVVGLALCNAGSMDWHTATGVWKMKKQKKKP